MNNKEFAQKARNILARKTKYNNCYPRNLCYFDGTYLSADCWNLAKSIVWSPSIDQNYTVGRFANPDFSTGLGDWTASGIVQNSKKVSTDMVNIPVGAFMYYYDGSHAGIYVGNRKVVESTVGWGANCVIETDLGPQGQRIFHGSQIGYWSKWCYMPGVTYVESDLVVGDIVKLAPGVNQDVHGTYLNVNYLNQQKLVIKNICNSIADVYNANGGWLEVQMYLTDLEKVKVEDVLYKITCKDYSYCCLKPSKLSAKAGEEITIEYEITEPYILKNLSVNNQIITGKKFIMPAANVDISAEFGITKYAINCLPAENGRISCDYEAATGSILEVEVTPQPGYRLAKLFSEQVEIAKDLRFVMPNKDVYIHAIFEKNSRNIFRLFLDLLQKLLDAIIDTK